MGLFAMAINTGSIAQDGGTSFKGLAFTQISESGMNPTGLGTAPLEWTDYRPLAKSRIAEEQNIFLLVSNLDAVPEPLGPDTYWSWVEATPVAVSGTLGLISQRPYYLPNYVADGDSTSFAVNSTSSWQWVDGLDQTILAWNENNLDRYYPRGYGWVLGVEKNGTPGGWNVKAYFWGATGQDDAASEASFVALVNSLPTGAYQTTANNRNYTPTQGNQALEDVFFNTYTALPGTDGNVANYVVVQNRGDKSTTNDVGQPNFMRVVTGSIF